MGDDFIKLALTKNDLFLIILALNKVKRDESFEYSDHADWLVKKHSRRFLGKFTEEDQETLEMFGGNIKFSGE